MTQKNTCQHMYDCTCECPEHMNCPLDKEMPKLKKDRSISRNRHHCKVKEKHKSIKNARILSSKANRIPDSAPSEKIQRANQKAVRAHKKAKRYK